MKFPKEVKQKWVEALRSGKYKQGHGELNDGEGGYCCLGVLAEVMQPGVTDHDGPLGGLCTLRSSMTAQYFVRNHQLEALYEDNETLWSHTANYSVNEDLRADNCLMCLNDDARLTFEEIADLIEKAL